jgi:hypothetical protein
METKHQSQGQTATNRRRRPRTKALDGQKWQDSRGQISEDRQLVNIMRNLFLARSIGKCILVSRFRRFSIGGRGCVSWRREVAWTEDKRLRDLPGKNINMNIYIHTMVCIKSARNYNLHIVHLQSSYYLREVSIYNGYNGWLICGFNGGVISWMVQFLPKSWVCALTAWEAH